MKPSFHHKLVNSPLEDPCLFVRILRERRALQFDLGDIGRLSAAEMNRITDVFISHAHIDHFIGFDRLLRVLLRRETPLSVYGPPGIISCVAGKLRGYTWNLITDYPAVINVIAFSGRRISRAVFRAKNRFRREAGETGESDGLLLKDPLFLVRAVRLDHDTACLAFSLEEECHINIHRDALVKKGLTVGPWLTLYKRFLREADGDMSREFPINGKKYTLGQLADIAEFTRGQKIVYATDIAMTPGNISALTRLARGADDFFCEAYFMEKDRDRALERFHLTAKACGSIARNAGAKRLSVVHISPKYSDSPEKVIEEATREFGR